MMGNVLLFILGVMFVVNGALIVGLLILKRGELYSQNSKDKLPEAGQIGTIKMIYRDDRLLVEMDSQDGGFDVVCEIQSFAGGFPRVGHKVQVSAVNGCIVLVQQVVNDGIANPQPTA